MFFDSVVEIPEIAKRNGTSIFVVPDSQPVEIKNAIMLSSEGKATITIDQVRNVMRLLNVRQVSHLFVVIRPAELMNEEAANALLKNLEEPGEKVHFVLITEAPSRILPTILSRAKVYFLRSSYDIMGQINVDDKIKALSKKLMVARPKELTAIAEEIVKHRDNVREYALNVVGTAVEMLYKTFLITGKTVFLKKIPKFLEVYEAIYKNGHIKLHLVADLC